MTLRGIIKNGVVVLDDADRLPDGTPVEVSPVDNGASLTSLDAFGIWRDRTDLGSGADASRALRARIERRNA